MRITFWSIPLLVALALSALPAAASPYFSERGYRIDHYRSPTPATAPGATTVQTAEVIALREQTPAPVVIDVLNLTYRHGRFLQSEPHLSLPGALWLPNTGLGHLDDDWHYDHDWLGYLLTQVLEATDGHRDHPVIVLCRADCWLSWNAAKRLHEAGFGRLYWYRDGLDAWLAAGLPLEEASPPLPSFATP